jgi:glucose-1-phosphate cytidylyltransferase
MTYRHDRFFYALGMYREYQYLNKLWRSKQTPWKVWSE